MKKIFFGTNTKMYQTSGETLAYLRELSALTADMDRDVMELFVIPPYISLERAASEISQDAVMVGAQNMCWEDQGQFTGEISPRMLKDLGVRLVMIGHSERRHIFHETDQEENKKVLSALDHGFTALLCIGETLEQKNFGISDESLRIQLKIGLSGVREEQLSRLRIAYEPVWAIGVNGIPASPGYAQERHHAIKNCLQELFGSGGAQIPVLYGGSVNAENAPSLIVQPDIDGLFVGRSAWNAADFNKLIRDSISRVMTQRPPFYG